MSLCIALMHKSLKLIASPIIKLGMMIRFDVL